MTHPLWKKACAAAALGSLLAPATGFAQQANAATEERVPPFRIPNTPVDVAPPSSAAVAKYTLPPAASASDISYQDEIALLRKKVKYVFVLFQENRSFDFYFGTYPGARGLFSQADTAGFHQPLVLADGSVGKISPFLIPQSVAATNGKPVLLYPEDTDSVNHGHAAIDAKLDLDENHVARNDRYAFVEEGLKGTLSSTGITYTGPAPTAAQVQKGELVMGHVDCDTAPFLWNYADRFTLFDNFFDTVTGPSTPNAIAMIAGQSGETQWIKHPELASNVNTTNMQLPVTADPQPFWGSALDVLTPAGQKQPTESGGAPSASPAANLTFATLPLSFMGKEIRTTTASELNPTYDLLDVQEDISKIAGDGNLPINWGWFQEGYDHESTDAAGTVSNSSYIAHHNAPQYFGYIANNPVETKAHLRGLGDFYAAIANQQLPSSGVFYVRGGYNNLDGLVPRAPSAAVKAAFQGNDDHPGYSDAQISEALLADSVNAIAASPYWKDSAIVITYDETDGLFDHTKPQIRSFDPNGLALDQGPRIPMLVISPYSRAHTISHEVTEHGSIIKFIDQIFNLTALADLPDEAAARKLGKEKYGQDYLGPSDDHTPSANPIVSAFEPARLLGQVPPLPASYAMIPAAQVTSLPHYGAQGCKALQITPTDYVEGKVIDPAPADFNPRPSTNPGLPTSGSWPNN